MQGRTLLRTSGNLAPGVARPQRKKTSKKLKNVFQSNGKPTKSSALGSDEVVIAAAWKIVWERGQE